MNAQRSEKTATSTQIFKYENSFEIGIICGFKTTEEKYLF